MKKGWLYSGNPGRGKAYIQHEKCLDLLMNTYMEARPTSNMKKGLAMLMDTYMEARPTSNMKKGWLCRTSYDE